MKDKIKLIVVLLFIIIIAGFFIFKPKSKVETGVKGNSDVKVPDIVVSENYQDPWFRKWLAENYEKDLIDHKSYVREWSEVIQYIQDSPFYKDTALLSEKGWANEKIADPWLIAIAKRENYTIVTDEVKNINLSDKNPSKNAKIPDVCEEFKIRCISMNQFFAEIGLSI